MTRSAAVRSRLEAAGMRLPEPPVPAGAYVPATRAQDLIFTAGQLPVANRELMATGKVGREVSKDSAAECAQICALNALAAAQTVVDLDDVTAVIKLVGYVASADDFTEQPAVVDGASRVISIAFGDAGRHAREAVGVAVLPLNAPVEVSLVLEAR